MTIQNYHQGLYKMMRVYFIKLFFAVSLLFVVNPTFSAAAANSSTRYAEYSDWLVACDNVGDCHAIGFDETEVSLAMHIHRNAGPNGGISIAIMGGGSQPLDQFIVDGKKITLSSKTWSSSRDDYYKISTVKNDSALQFIDSIRNAKRIGFFNSQTAENSLSLKGLSAVLLLMDEAQGRLQTQHAFVRKGSKPEASVPAPRPLPKLKAAPHRGNALNETQTKKIIAAVRKQHAVFLAKEECDNFAEDNTFDEASMLSSSDVIALLECNRGAYQSYFFAFRASLNNPKQSQLLRFPMPPGETSEAAIGNAEYDSATATLTSFGKGRGIFDCGENTDWVFDGKDFQLSEHSRQTRCGGMNSPGEFPILWRSIVK
jgi:Protein of unknown function (DUF1176)